MYWLLQHSYSWSHGYKVATLFEQGGEHARCCRQCWLVLLVTVHLVLCFLRLSMSWRFHRCSFGEGDMPFVVPSKTVEIHQLQFLDKVQRPILMVQTVCRTKEIPLLLNKVIDVPVVQVVQLPRKLWFSTVALLRHVGDMPVIVHDRSWWCVQVQSLRSSSRSLRTLPLHNRDGYAQCICAWRWRR